MQPLEESRLRMESYLNEFFAPGTSNERKQQIEVMLDSYSKQTGSWKQALYFLSQSSSPTNDYVIMYCLSVIENTVKFRSLLIPPSEQRELQSTLYSFLLQHSSASSNNKCPNFVRNKIIKILTDLGKFYWPRSDPDFLSNILKVTANNDTVLIGLQFLKTMSEEWPNCKDEISSERKLELKVLLLREIPRIFELLQQILVAGLKLFAARNNSTPSQSHSQGGSMATISPVDPIMHEIISLALTTSSHYASWIPLDCFTASSQSNGQCKQVPFTMEFVKIVCQYSLVDTFGNRNSVEGESLSVLSLNILNELLYRKFVPREFDEHIKLVALFAIDLLSGLGNAISRNQLSNQYLDKAIEFLCLVTSSHFFRYDLESSKAFTSLMLPFTFAQSDSMFYYECLEIWKLLLDQLIAEVPFANISTNRDDVLESFKQPFLDLAFGIVTSTAKFNLVESDHYFDDEEEEESEAPSLSKNIDVLVKIGELLPSESLDRLMSTWTNSCQYFASLQSKMDQSKTVLTIESSIDVKHFSFIVQLIGRMAEIFYGDIFNYKLELGKSLVQQLVGLMIVSKNLYFVQVPEVILQANCEIVYSLRTWMYWLGRYHSEIVLTECSASESSNFYEILTATAEVLCFCLENRSTVNPQILLAHANLLATLVNSIRSQHVFNIPWIQTLIEKIQDLRSSLSKDAFRVLNKAIASLILLPWHNISDQEWPRRTQLYNNYMKNVVGDLVSSSNDPDKLVVGVNILNDQLDLLTTECGNSKKICWGVFKEITHFIHKLVPMYLKQNAVNEEILNFFLKVMEVLRQQAGASFFSDTVKIFLNYLSAENIINDILKETDSSSSSSIVIEKFLEILRYMVKDPSPSFKKFLPDSLSIALDHIYPVLAQRTSPDVKIPFFQFIRDAVNFKWTYFYPGFLVNSPPSLEPSPPPVTDEEAEIGRRLYQIFESIGHSFLQSDLEVFRFNLNTLSIWNQKHQMYRRMSIDPKMLDKFMIVLIQVLARKSHDSLKEDISLNLYDMALVDYSRFCSVFLPQTLQDHFPLLKPAHRVELVSNFTKPMQQQRSSEDVIDLTSFVNSLHKFMDDLRYAHFCIESMNLMSSNGSGSDRTS